MRINKFIAQSADISRRKAETYILDGRVKLNGEVIIELGVQVGPGDTVHLDNELLRPNQTITTIAFNKPTGYLSSKKDTHGRPTVYDLLPKEYQHLNYIGRLDLNSHGLMLFSNNGELVHRLTHPSYSIPRRYLVELDSNITESDAQELRNGVLIDENERTRAAEVKFKGKNVDITLREGKKREIRRMMSALGYTVIDLQRISYGAVELKDLALRKCRPLTDTELKELYEMVQLHS